MTVDKRVNRNLPDFINKDKAFGANKRDPGPYIGIVKNNADPTRSGRLQVFVADFGGLELEQSHWITVSYASPYMGAARTPFVKSDPSKLNEYPYVNHSYGMWFTPPDIGNHVLLTFVNGDINRGYWFACIMPDLSHHAIPAIGGSSFVAVKDPELKSALTKPPYPVVEYNDENDALLTNESNFLEIPKPVHEHQIRTLLEQGLEDDKVRGVISSSSQRESPSRVFGISTPGLEGFKDKDDTVTWRKGGHTFVMDDGVDTGNVGEKGKDQLIRLRSAGGHQILMNDSEEIIYISSANGKTWMEFTKDGKISMFAANDISVRSERNINFHSDKDINMFAKENIKMFAGTNIQQQSENISLKGTTSLKEYGGLVEVKSGGYLHMIAGGDASIGAGSDLVCAAGMIYLNTKAAPDVVTPQNIPVVEHPEPIKTGLKWENKGKRSSTIPLDTRIPTHEPYYSHATSGTGSVSTPAPITSSRTVTADGAAPPVGPGPTSTTGDGVKIKATDAAVENQIATYPGPAIGPLTSNETAALKAQIARHESGGIDNYTAVGGSGGNYLGKYQFGTAALVTQGYINKEIYNATPASQRGALVNDPANWTGVDGITSKEAFLASPATQEKVMDQNLVQNYNQLKQAGVVNGNSDPAVVSGNLSAAHLKGAGATIQWNKGTLSNTTDGFGTDIGTYYNEGRYANTVLAKNYTASTTLASASGASLVNSGSTKTV